MLDLFPDTAAVEEGELVVGGVRVSTLAEEFGTPLVVYCERTLLAHARAYRRAAPEALVAYSVKAFPSIAVLRLLAAEGLGADVWTLGELAFAREAGIAGERIVVHGNNKSEEELRAAAEVGAGLLVLDALDEVERAAATGIRRVLVGKGERAVVFEEELGQAVLELEAEGERACRGRARGRGLRGGGGRGRISNSGLFIARKACSAWASSL